MKNPEIRFIDDNIDWIKKPLSEILNERNTSTYKNNGLDHVSLTKEGVIPKSDRYERDFLVTTENKKYKITKLNDICYNPANLKFGVICRNKYKDGIFSPIYITFETIEEVLPSFIELLVTDNSFIKASLKFQEGTVYERMAVSPENLLKMPVSIPAINIQSKISEVSKYIDIKIKEEEILIKKLKDTKSSLLLKMFPQENQSVPELRFDGFTNDWEQRKLGQQMYIKARIGWQALTKSEYLESGNYYLITGTDIDENSHTVDLKKCFYVSKERYEMDEKIQVHEGDIIVTKDGTIGKIAMVTGLDRPATLNSHLFVLRDLSGKVDNYFLLTVLNSHLFDAFVESTKTGSTLTGMPQKTFIEFPFLLPDIKEQKRIATFYRSLDHLITLHQCKPFHLNFSL